MRQIRKDFGRFCFMLMLLWCYLNRKWLSTFDIDVVANKLSTSTLISTPHRHHRSSLRNFRRQNCDKHISAKVEKTLFSYALEVKQIWAIVWKSFFFIMIVMNELYMFAIYWIGPVQYKPRILKLPGWMTSLFETWVRTYSANVLTPSNPLNSSFSSTWTFAHLCKIDFNFPSILLELTHEPPGKSLTKNFAKNN